MPPQVRGYALYTALPEPRWRSFEIPESLWRRLEGAILAMPGEQPPEHVVSSTLYEIAKDSRWNQEEAIREIKRGECDAACRRLTDNLQRGYAIEMALKGH